MTAPSADHEIPAFGLTARWGTAPARNPPTFTPAVISSASAGVGATMKTNNAVPAIRRALALNTILDRADWLILLPSSEPGHFLKESDDV